MDRSHLHLPVPGRAGLELITIGLLLAGAVLLALLVPNAAPSGGAGRPDVRPEQPSSCWEAGLVTHALRIDDDWLRTCRRLDLPFSDGSPRIGLLVSRHRGFFARGAPCRLVDSDSAVFSRGHPRAARVRSC